MKKRILTGLVAVSIAGGAQTAFANEMKGSSSSDWNVTIGLGAGYGPVSPGLDEKDTVLLPIVDIEFKDRFFIKSSKGIGGYLVKPEGNTDYAIGLALGYDAGREESDARAELDGLGDIDSSAEAVLFFEGDVGPFGLEFEIAKGLGSDGHEGVHAELSAALDTRLNDRLSLSAGPFITYGDDRHTQSYYGVSAAQAANSATYSQYDASGGFQSVGLELTAHYQLSENWSMLGFGKYTQLLGDAKDSPIVDDDGFFGLGAAVTYSF